ncbi:hypothetical protein GNZ01_05805 [Escherichia coli]|uniref:WWE domain-containing protein n=1 Tax=Escherichia coli TaxID=562 RepID=A0AAJ2Y2C7_ECOLX|nr:hypothetical protein [Escherichia coli]MED6924361.1 hypothetical protein [Escherichia coli O157]MDI0694608.1 hypothetical protein [Escherichia coli]MDI1143935.1 hypothetical protein [Escherichia coli]MUM71402.1 hypothetical protein [Escherichia coli]MUM82761.1 hypothetical protein [Escherichia coli]
MLIYLSVIVISLLVSFAVLKIVAICRSKIDSSETRSVLDLIMDHPKICAIIVLFVVLINTYIVREHLYNMYDCSVRSISQGVETDYSWYYEKCRFKNQHGIWVDFDKLRGTPSGEEE